MFGIYLDDGNCLFCAQEQSLLAALKPEEVADIEMMIVAIMNCLFVRNQAMVEHFRMFEQTFEKSSIISVILSIICNFFKILRP
jgi:hypothetical protein